MVHLYASHARTLVALSGADFETAFQHASAISPAGVLAPYVPHALWLILDLVEAASRSGRQAEADAHVRAVAEADIAAVSPRLAMVAAGAAAMAASDEECRALFDTALAHPRRRSLAVRPRQNPALLRREAATRQVGRRSARTSGRRTPNLHPARRRSLVHACQQRTAGHRPDRWPNTGTRARITDPAATADCRTRGVRADQLADWRAPLPFPQNSGHPSASIVPQTGRDHSCRASRRSWRSAQRAVAILRHLIEAMRPAPPSRG